MSKDIMITVGVESTPAGWAVRMRPYCTKTREPCADYFYCNMFEVKANAVAFQDALLELMKKFEGLA